MHTSEPLFFVTSLLVLATLGSAQKGLTACEFYTSANDLCATLTPGFPYAASADQASCLCYSSTVWMPNLYDGIVSSCFDYISTAAPESYSELEYIAGGSLVSTPCNEAGNVALATTTDDARPGAAATHSYPQGVEGGTPSTSSATAARSIIAPGLGVGSPGPSSTSKDASPGSSSAPNSTPTSGSSQTISRPDFMAILLVSFPLMLCLMGD